jgi:hypothetical protein
MSTLGGLDATGGPTTFVLDAGLVGPRSDQLRQTNLGGAGRASTVGIVTSRE